MASNEAAEEQVTFSVKSSSDQKHTLTLPLSTTVAEVKAKLSEKDFADVPVDRQRLIYSGRILKDGDTLDQVKVKDGNTIHLVKSAASNARQNPSGASSDNPIPPAAQIPTNLAAGTGNSPFAHLTGARHAGFHGLPSASTFGPDGGMGPPPGLDDMASMLENPMFASQMNEMLNNPQILDMMLDQSPQFRNNPQGRAQIRAMLQNPEMRRLMFNPEMLRMQLQMQRAMEGGGQGGSTFAMPGETDTTAQTGSGNPTQGANQAPRMPPLFGQGAPGGNPFAALFGQQGQGNTPLASPPAAASTGQGSPAAQPSDGAPPPPGIASDAWREMMESAFRQQPNPDGSAPAGPNFNTILQNLQQAMAQGSGQGNLPPNLFGGAGGMNPFAAFGGGAAPQEPPDNRPPEERYESQLRQLNDMGFFDFDRNVQALRRSGGSVQGAIEHLLSSS